MKIVFALTCSLLLVSLQPAGSEIRFYEIDLLWDEPLQLYHEANSRENSIGQIETGRFIVATEVVQLPEWLTFDWHNRTVFAQKEYLSPKPELDSAPKNIELKGEPSLVFSRAVELKQLSFLYKVPFSGEYVSEPLAGNLPVLLFGPSRRENWVTAIVGRETGIIHRTAISPRTVSQSALRIHCVGSEPWWDFNLTNRNEFQFNSGNNQIAIAGKLSSPVNLSGANEKKLAINADQITGHLTLEACDDGTSPVDYGLSISFNESPLQSVQTIHGCCSIFTQ